MLEELVACRAEASIPLIAVSRFGAHAWKDMVCTDGNGSKGEGSGNEAAGSGNEGDGRDNEDE
jgi:hypothetical protein